MSKRRDPELVEDISEAITRIERYTAGLTLDAFLADTKTQDATVRNLEIIGEAVKGLSSEFRKKHQSVPWPDIAGMRDRLIHGYDIHGYDSVDLEELCKTSTEDIPVLLAQVRKI